MRLTHRENVEQLTKYVSELHDLYNELLKVVNELDVTSTEYMSDVEELVLLEFDMQTSYCDEEVDEKYSYAMCEMLIRTYRSVLYAVAIERLNSYHNDAKIERFNKEESAN